MSDDRTILVVSGGLVADAHVVPADAVIAAGGASVSWEGGSFPASSGVTYVEQPGAGVRWVLQGGALVAPPEPLPTPEDLVRVANLRQWAMACSGFAVTIGGQVIPFATNESALSLMDGKVMRLAQPNPPASVNWQVGPTAFVAIEADNFVHAATLVSDYVQATFDMLPTVFAAIAAGTIKTYADLDAVAWPANTATIP